MNKRPSLPGPRNPFQRLVWRNCLINSGPMDFSRARKQHRPTREHITLMRPTCLHRTVLLCCVTLGESPHLSGDAESLHLSGQLRAFSDHKCVEGRLRAQWTPWLQPSKLGLIMTISMLSPC